MTAAGSAHLGLKGPAWPADAAWGCITVQFLSSLLRMAFR